MTEKFKKMLKKAEITEEEFNKLLEKDTKKAWGILIKNSEPEKYKRFEDMNFSDYRKLKGEDKDFYRMLFPISEYKLEKLPSPKETLGGIFLKDNKNISKEEKIKLGLKQFKTFNKIIKHSSFRKEWGSMIHITSEGKLYMDLGNNFHISLKDTKRSMLKFGIDIIFEFIKNYYKCLLNYSKIKKTFK